MPFRWSLNPYMGCVHRCTFCYVRHFEQRADRPSDDRYGRSIRIKPNIAEVLRRELARPSWQRDEVALGTATDPYQPAEGRFRLTRACLTELDAAWTPFSIVTRGPLVVRDIDVLQQASARAGAQVFFSLPTLDERVWRTTEPGTAPPASRLEAIRRLAAAGVDVGVGMAPILPGLSDDPQQLEAVVRAARAAGARGDLGERRASAAGRARALPRGAGPRLARGGRAIRGALRQPRVSQCCHDEADARARAACDCRHAEPDADGLDASRRRVSWSLPSDRACRNAPTRAVESPSGR